MKPTKYNLTRTLLLVITLLYAPFCLLAQQNVQVKGRVTDATTDKPLEGVSITLKNSSYGTSTDKQGDFKIGVLKGEKLTFSFSGYQTQVVNATENFITIRLTPVAKQLEDVVVTALGIKKESKRLGYAVQEIKGADLVKAREPNPINGLVGKVAGLDVAISREMLAAPAVSLRGGNISLYVVDGMPITSDTWNISPDDIESYTILKGLAATALYGSRAQNGAILITTKKGKKNTKGYTIEINSSTQIDKGFIALPKTQALYGGGDNSQYSFVDGKGGGLNDGDYDVWGPKFEGQLIAQFDSPIDPATGLRKPTPYIQRGKDNLKNFIQAGILTTNNLSFSAATDRANIRMSLSNSYQRGIVPNTKLNIYNFNLNTSYELSSKIKIEGGLNYNRQATPNIPDVQYGPNSVIYNMTIWTGADWDVNAPDIRNYWQPGKEGIQSNFAEYQRYHNPWFMSYEWLRGHYKTDVYGNFGLTYKANKNIEALVRGNISTNDVLRTEKLPYSAHPYGREGNRGDYREDRRSLIDNNVEGLVKYNGKVKDQLTINAIAGVNARNFSYNSSYTTTDYLNVPNLYSFSNSLNPIKAYSYTASMLVLSAYYSATLDYKNYLSLTTTGRVDKHSTLRTNNNKYFYPSISLATAVSDYVKLPNAISFLKFRASYASAKSPDVTQYIGPAAYPLGYGAPYVTVFGGPAYSLSDPAYTIGTVYNNQTGAYAPGNKLDPDVKSSELTSTEYGMDIKFLKNRLSFNATYYSNIKGPNIRSLPISQTSGLTGLTTNAIKTKLSGVELSLSGTPIQKQNGLRWDVLVNWSTYKEVYKDLPAQFESYQFHQGDRVDKLFASVVARTPDGQVINNSAGYPVYLPKQQYVGNGDVKWSWAINNKISYKTFSLSFQFDGKVGGIVQDYVKRKSTEGGSNIETAEGAVGAAREYEFRHYKDAGFAGSYIGEGVQVSNGTTIQYDPVTGVITNMSALQFATNTSKAKWIQDYVNSFFNNFEHTSVAKTYAKLREVVLTYSIPTSVLGKKSFISKIDVSLVGRNLLYFFPSRFHDIDVDQYSGRNIYESNSREPNLQTPTTRSYGVNLNIVF
ncbi:SusC/RagA family TonB-linked outer membrane protein [Ferruginibacter sp. SUN106]|uniref:SusC/RagA family TonB-linked outer membrane protein n=1 Tax=Ferruginibacter sp. SUN106 TaxID=2978348 RepID=UPI003D3678F2